MRWVQASLNQALGLNLAVTGFAGADTRQAIRQFQTQHNLPVSGYVGPDTRQALLRAGRESPPANGAAALEPPTGNTPARPETPAGVQGELLQAEINRRSRDYNRWLQMALNRFGQARLSVDGDLGPATRAALIRFQRSHRLQIDGRPGPETERALVAAGAPHPPGRAAAATRPLTIPGVPSNLRGLRRQIVQTALQELQRWGNGRIQEQDPRIRPVLEAYWRTGVGYLPTQPNWWSSVPWSAAFISYVMRRAGAGQDFRYSAGHSYYTVAAKQNRLANNANPFKAYRITEVAPRVGDLVCKSRSGSGATYDNIRGGMPTHCDIVVAVEPGRLITVGGNVRNSVRITPVAIDRRGLITQARYFAVIRSGP